VSTAHVVADRSIPTIRAGSLVHRTLRAFGDDHGTLLAAAIAYYVLFSFIPLMTLMLAIFGFVMRDPQAQQSALDHLLGTIPLGQNVIFDWIRSVSRHSGTLSLIGFAGLVWASSGMFGAVRSALNIAWDVEPRHGIVLQQLIDFGAALGLGVLLMASMAGTILAHFLQTLSLRSGIPAGQIQTLFRIGGLLLPALISFAAFLLIYRKVPNVKHGTGDVWPGALLATVLFELSKHGFAFYVSHYNSYQAIYGVLGGVMLFMLWTYLAAMILLIGAEFASEFEKGRRQRLTAS
jgi:membrane protein